MIRVRLPDGGRRAGFRRADGERMTLRLTTPVTTSSTRIASSHSTEPRNLDDLDARRSISTRRASVPSRRRPRATPSLRPRRACANSRHLVSSGFGSDRRRAPAWRAGWVHPSPAWLMVTPGRLISSMRSSTSSDGVTSAAVSGPRHPKSDRSAGARRPVGFEIRSQRDGSGPGESRMSAWRGYLRVGCGSS